MIGPLALGGGGTYTDLCDGNPFLDLHLEHSCGIEPTSIALHLIHLPMIIKSKTWIKNY